MKTNIPGFTLIELVTALAIIALLVTAAVPLATTWIDQARATEASAQVRFAYSKARAMALRGQGNAFVCFSDGVIYVYGENPLVCGAVNPLPLWQSRLAGGSGTTVRMGNESGPIVNCFAFSNKGWLTDLQIGDVSCVTGTDTKITTIKGAKSVSKNIL